MIKMYFSLKTYKKYIVTKHSNPRNRGHPPSNLLKSVIENIHTLYNNSQINTNKTHKWILCIKFDNIGKEKEKFFFSKEEEEEE